jgi:hypothetical protein
MRHHLVVSAGLGCALVGLLGLIGLAPASAASLKPTSGTVTSVNGATTPGTCGTAGAAGAFTLATHKGLPVMVDVSSATSFVDRAVSSPSFAVVCVGDKVRARGTQNSDGSINATLVKVHSPR